MPNIVVVGAQWGDEGKGKIIDVLTANADWVVRYQGGNNAGHTVEIDDQSFRGRGASVDIVAAGYRACLWLRTANRVLQPVASFPCPSQEALYEGVYGLDWQELLTPPMTLAVDANLRDSDIPPPRFSAL